MGSCFSSHENAGAHVVADKARLNRPLQSSSVPSSEPASNSRLPEAPNPRRKDGDARTSGNASRTTTVEGDDITYSSSTKRNSSSSSATNSTGADAKSNNLHSAGPALHGTVKQAGAQVRVLPPGPGTRGGGKIHTLGLPETNLRSFTYQELKAATRGFNRDFFVGEGGFGNVYQGWIDKTGQPGSGEVVAVKVLNTEGLQGHKEWKAEVNFLGLLHHPNLVRLIGYCAEEEQRLLVYEYMPRGSLELHLFQKSAPDMPWSVRMKVALGAARGLAYLHEEAERQVIYRDFKTSNILLDENFEAKLSDFGLAKDGPEGDKTHVSTRVMGTYGYAAPEYVMTGHLTAKSDVYSYGVVLLELITGRRSMDKFRPAEEHNLVDWARGFFADKRKLYRLMDPRLEGQYSVRAAQKAAVLAQHCLYRDPKARPLMSDVVETLKPLQDLTDMAAAFHADGPGPRPPAGPQPPPHQHRPWPLPLPQNPAQTPPAAVAPGSVTPYHRSQGGLHSTPAASRSADVRGSGRAGGL